MSFSKVNRLWLKKYITLSKEELEKNRLMITRTLSLVFLYYFVGFPFQRDRRHMPHIPSLGYSHCEVIRFRPFVFYPDKPVQVQVTVNHIDTRDMNYVHDAAVSWIEGVTYEQFTACVMAAGFNERRSRANVSIDWIAYQGAPEGGVSGEERMSQWWTGTTCKTVRFPSVSDFFYFSKICFYLIYCYLGLLKFVWFPRPKKIPYNCEFCICCQSWTKGTFFILI